jgi:hypothetical protein
MTIDDEERQATQDQMLALHRRAEMWRQRAEAAERERDALKTTLGEIVGELADATGQTRASIEKAFMLDF